MSRETDWLHRSDREELVDAYITLTKASGFKIGDKVKVLRKFEPRKLGCSCSWVPEMDAYLNQVGKVFAISGIIK